MGDSWGIPVFIREKENQSQQWQHNKKNVNDNNLCKWGSNTLFTVANRILGWNTPTMIEFKFLLYQLFRSVADCEGYDGNVELGLDSEEGALETATTSKEGSRRAIYPMSPARGSDFE